MHRTAGTGAFCSSWRYRFLNFTHIAPRAIGLLLLSGLLHAPFPSLSLFFSPNHSPPIFRSHSHIPVPEEPPIVLYSETSFCFILPSFPSLSRSLSLYGLLYIYMRFRAFHLCTPIVRTGKLRARFAASTAEKGAKRVGRIRSNGARAER